MVKESISNKYFKVLKLYVAAPDEKYLVEASELGRELVMMETPPEEIAEMQEAALARLAEEAPDMTLIESLRTMSAPLMELLMAYGLAFREWIENRKQAEEALQKANDELEAKVRERTKELEEKNAELERMNDVFTGREFRIKELRDRVKELELKIEDR
ncbi:MAG: hypothetical protein JRI92_02640 [Deltaproteobacteria bacterium]|nr:hypothetical protein [Deltaproteobacteria bacterium]